MEIVYDDDAVRRVMHTLTTGALAREGGVTADGRCWSIASWRTRSKWMSTRYETGWRDPDRGIMEHVEEAGVHSGDSRVRSRRSRSALRFWPRWTSTPGRWPTRSRSVV